MEFVHEVTAYLENKPGRLAKICSALAHEKIDIRALSVMDTADRSVLRFVTDDLEPTREVLTSLGTEFEVAEVLAVEMDNRPGALAGSSSGSPRSTSTSNTPTSRGHRAGPVAGDLPHVEPEARPAGPQRGEHGRPTASIARRAAGPLHPLMRPGPRPVPRPGRPACR